MKIGLFVDAFASIGKEQEDEYQEIEQAFRDAYPEETNLIFKRDMQPHNLKNNPVDVYLFDFGGLCYTDFSGSFRMSFASEIVKQLKDLPNTLFIPYSKMTRDYVHDAMEELFPGIQAPNMILPSDAKDDDWAFNPIIEATKKWKNTLTGTGSPISTFFEPDASFFPWLVEYLKGRAVVEIGCGNCRMIRRMHLHKIKAMGIDPLFDIKNHPDLGNACLNQTGQECRAIRTKQKMVVLFCRPCHNGFVEETCEQVGPNAEILYISLPKNVEEDLPPPWVATELPDVPGLTGGEKVYTVKKMPPNGDRGS